MPAPSSKKRHILFCFAYFQTKLKYWQHYLLENLAENGHTISIISTDIALPDTKGYIQQTEMQAGTSTTPHYTLYRLACSSIKGKPFPKHPQQLYRLLEEIPYDLLHTDGVLGFFRFACYFFNQKNGKNKPVFINDHSNPALKNESLLGSAYYGFHAFLFRFLNRNLASVICPNKGSYQLLQNRYALGTKLSIVPLGYDASLYTFKPQQKNQETKTILGFAGKIDPLKRLEVLFEALSKTQNKQQFKLIVVGYNASSYGEDLVSLALSLQLDVEFRPLLHPIKLAEFYNYIDLAVFPGSISNTTLEATGCGTPIALYASIEGLEDRVDQGRGQLFYTENELVSILDAFQKHKVDNQAIEEQNLRFSWHIVTQTYAQLYYTNLN